MMYRQLQEVMRRLPDMQEKIRASLLSDNIREMTTLADEAHAIAEDVKFDLDHLLNNSDGSEEGERRFAQAALDSLQSAILNAQKVALATNVNETRARVLEFKTRADYADAYLHAALGFEME